MNILFLSSLFPPLGHSGHDERCQEAVRGFVRAGKKVQVLTSDHRLPPVGSIKETGVIRELRLHEDSGQADLLGRDYQATLAHERYNAGVLNHRLRRFEPDLVYVWNMKGLSKSLLFQIQQSGIPVVYDIHANWILSERFDQDPWFRLWSDESTSSGMIRRGLGRLFGRSKKDLKALPIGRASGLDISRSYACSRSLRDALVIGGVSSAASLPVIYPFVDEANLAKKEEFRSDGRRFMWAGRLNRNKAPELALAAVKILRDRGFDHSLDLFGLGRPTELKEMRRQIELMGLQEFVRMKGIRPGELPQHFSTYDAFWFTSRETDPFPVTVMQAIFSKLPCICAEAGGIYELLRDVEGLIHYRVGDVDALADAVESFCQLPDGGKSLVENCILRLRGAGSFENLLEHVMSGGNAEERAESFERSA